MEFQPMELNSLRNTETIFIVLLTVCLFCFAFESSFRNRYIKEFHMKYNSKVHEIVDSNLRKPTKVSRIDKHLKLLGQWGQKAKALWAKCSSLVRRCKIFAIQINKPGQNWTGDCK